MDWHQYVRTRLAGITGNAARDEEIVEELAQHLAERFEDARAAGTPADDAFQRAARELTNTAPLVAALRDADRPRPMAPSPPSSGGAHIMHDLWQDVRYAIRLLKRSPGFTAAAVATLALGIGMTAAIFGVVDGVLLRPMPLPDAGRLVILWETDRASGTSREPASFPDFLDYRQRSRSVDRIGAMMAFDVTLEPDAGDPTRVAVLATTPEVLEMLGARSILGRRFTPEDDQPNAPATAIISDRLWSAAFGRGDAIGRTIRLGDRASTIIGVVDTNADFGVSQMLRAADYGGGFATRDARIRVDVWTPLQGSAERLPRSTHPVILLGRLAGGVTQPAAQDELSRIASDLEREYPRDNESRGISVESLQGVIFGPVATPLLVLMAAVGLVLVMACANVANLLLTRGARRVREVAVRSALGAEMSRLVRQFVAENIVLTMGSGLLALVLAFVALRTLVAIAPGEIPRLAQVAIDGRVLLLAFGSAAVIGLVFSLVPVLQARRGELQTVLRAEESRGATAAEGHLFRSTLVVAEVALAVVLVSGAGLLIKSFWHLRTTDPGFAAAGVLKGEFQLPISRYPVRNNPLPTSAAIERFNGELLRRVSALPGVESVAFAANHPLDGGFASSFMVEGREGEAAAWPEISIRRVTADYFKTLQIGLIRGRFARDGDSATGPVVVVNRTVEERFFPNETAVGHRMRFWGTAWTIVGVVGDERFQGVAKEPPIAVYLPLAAVPSSAESLIVRGSGDLATLATSVRATIRELDPLLVVFGLEPLAETLAQSLSEQWFLMVLLGLFAGLALLLAAVGVYGVLSCSVAQRNREIAIRMALGANGSRVMRAIVGEAARLTAVGLILGLALTFALARFIQALLFGVTSTDPSTLAAVVVTLAAIATLSAWLPVRRAAHVDPLETLRQE